MPKMAAETCACHQATMDALQTQLDGLTQGQDRMREEVQRLREDIAARLEAHDKAHTQDILRVHERIDKIELASREEDKCMAEKLAKMQNRVSLYVGMAVVWFTLLQLAIGAAVSVVVKGAFGG